MKKSGRVEVRRDRDGDTDERLPGQERRLQAAPLGERPRRQRLVEILDALEADRHLSVDDRIDGQRARSAASEEPSDDHLPQVGSSVKMSSRTLLSTRVVGIGGARSE